MKTERLNIRMSPELKKLATQKATLREISTTKYIQQLIEKDHSLSDMTFSERCSSYLPYNKLSNLLPSYTCLPKNVKEDFRKELNQLCQILESN